MRSVSVRACGAALLILLVAVTPVPAFAGRIQPPGGIAAAEEPPSDWELFLVWLQWRIMPPGG
jgi:hypothetical protein